MSGGISQSTASIAQEIAAGRLHAHEKHGENSIEAVPADDPRWLSILVEEVGEAAHTLTYDAVGLADMVTGEPLSSAEELAELRAEGRVYARRPRSKPWCPVPAPTEEKGQGR